MTDIPNGRWGYSKTTIVQSKLLRTVSRSLAHSLTSELDTPRLHKLLVKQLPDITMQQLRSTDARLLHVTLRGLAMHWLYVSLPKITQSTEPTLVGSLSMRNMKSLRASLAFGYISASYPSSFG